VQTLTDTASNVNRFVESVCELQTVVLRGNSKAAHNIKLSEILKNGALVVYQTVVLRIPPFLKLRQALLRYRLPYAPNERQC